jgi:hypothetical protein
MGCVDDDLPDLLLFERFGDGRVRVISYVMDPQVQMLQQFLMH